MSQHKFDLLDFPDQIALIEKGVYIGSTTMDGVDISLFLTKGNYWVEVFYCEDGVSISFIGLCPEERLWLYVEGHDLADIL